MDKLTIKEVERLIAVDPTLTHTFATAGEVLHQLLDTMRENEENCRLLGMSGSREAALLAKNERLRKALGKEITCVCQGMVGTPVRIYHHRYCLNNPNKDAENVG